VSSNSVSSPLARDFSVGIVLGSSNDVRVRSNSVSGFGTGLILTASRDNRVVSNDVTRTLVGISVTGSAPACCIALSGPSVDNVVSRNAVEGAAEDGIFVSGPQLRPCGDPGLIRRQRERR
jgi:parallel beta-helix repeat protein